MEVLSERKQQLLRGIIEEYVTDAKPVPSQLLVEKLGLELSSATIRNEMKDLEDAGFITQPHTSAGRIPTEIGYRYFLENFLNSKGQLDSTSQQELDQLTKVVSDQGTPGVVKTVMKGVAAKSNEAILISLNRSSFYYTGISNLFMKPEFQTMNGIMIEFTRLIDHLDEVMMKLHSADPDDDVTFYVGSDNPISQYCSVLVTPYRAGDVAGTMALLGPMRMQYQYNYELVKYTKSLLHDYE